MKQYKAHITHVPTGETRVINMDYCGERDSLVWLWEEGNYSCDCNRQIFFTGHYDDGDICGHGKFSVDRLTFEDGEVIWLQGPVEE